MASLGKIQGNHLVSTQNPLPASACSKFALGPMVLLDLQKELPNTGLIKVICLLGCL